MNRETFYSKGEAQAAAIALWLCKGGVPFVSRGTRDHGGVWVAGTTVNGVDQWA